MSPFAKDSHSSEPSGRPDFLLLGAEVPILPRTYEDSFISIEECYVSGLVDGEGLIEARKRADSDYNDSDTSWLQELHKSHCHSR